MIRFIFLLHFFFFCPFFLLHGQHKLGFKEILSTSGGNTIALALPNDSSIISLLQKENIPIKYKTPNWLHISQTPTWLDSKVKSNEISTYYLEVAPPVSLSDTALVRHHVLPVHLGTNGLSSAYTGKGVIIGIVDQGLDWQHPDFKDSLGNTRVLRYWDQSLSTGSAIPQPYNYGIVWNQNAINAGLCTSTENTTAHGTTVSGIAAGNGRANGTNTGMAPEANIIVVETNFSSPNWTLTVADAVDYIFKVADSLGMPAVVNLSLGSYLGSHDGNDPAAEMIESLLDEKEGRIVVSAAGNSGNQGKYHVHGEINQDTSFVWFQNNPSPTAYFGANHIYFDLWTDTSNADFNFAYGADTPAPSYILRGETAFRSVSASLNGLFHDTIYSNNGNRIAIIETYTEVVGGAFHLESYFSQIDSVNYLFRFMTTGSGKYDLWSGAWMGLNTIVSQVPSVNQFPSISFYHHPDTLQTIVSSWNCSEKVISVGNVRNRVGHIDANGNTYPSVYDGTPPGKLSINSSKGPSRTLVTKPDVCASGDVALGSAPLWFLANPANNAAIDSGGWHARNGGTSMASPVVAGIAALYLEKCPKARYSDFKSDLISTAFSDNYSGSVPNNAYGYGKPHALNLMLLNSFDATIVGDDTLCTNTGLLSLQSTVPLSTADWSNGNQGVNNTINEVGEYYAIAYNAQGCAFHTDTFSVIQLDPLPMLPIVQSGNTLATLSLTNYQWTMNGTDIPGATSSTLEIAPPYGIYTCYCTNDAGCISETDPYSPVVGLSTLNSPDLTLTIFPNPVEGTLTIQVNSNILSVRITDLSGREVLYRSTPASEIDVHDVQQGNYIIEVHTTDHVYYSKIMKL